MSKNFTIGDDSEDEQFEMKTKEFAKKFKPKAQLKQNEIQRAVTTVGFAIHPPDDDDDVRNCNLANDILNGTEINSNSISKPPKHLNFLSKIIPRTKSMPQLSKTERNNNLPNTNEISKGKNVSANKVKLNQNRKLHELVKWLHTPVTGYKQNLDQTDIELVNSLDHVVDLEKFLISDDEPREIWNARIKNIAFRRFSKIYRNQADGTISQKNDEISGNGYRLVRRFGYGIPDGCGFPLSLRKDSVNNEKDWKSIFDEADQTLQQFESFGGSAQARRGSLFQPRILFISPNTECGWNKVWQTGHCLPLRKWTSEVFIAPKEAELLDSEVKRHLKWTASIEDFRHLLSSDLNHFGTNIDSVLVEAKNKQLLDKKISNGITFRRQSFNQSIWNTKKLLSRKKADYENRLRIYREREMDNLKHNYSSAMVRLRSVFMDLDLTPKCGSSIAVLSPKDLAIELTLIVRKLIMNLTPTEISRIILQPHLVNQENCPHITALLDFQKRIIHLFATTVLDESTTAGRSKIIAHIIEVIEEVKHLRNFHSLYSIISSLQSPPIARLTQTWSDLYSTYSDHYFEYIFLSESLKKLNIDKMDLSTSNILLFNDWLKNLKIRCNRKLADITKGTKGQWTRPENLIPWLYGELETLESLASKTPIDEKKVKRKKVSLMKRIKRNFSNKNIQSLGENEKINSNQATLKVTPCLPISQKLVKCEDIASNEIQCDKHVFDLSDSLNIDILKLNEQDERIILKEISNGLKEYQERASRYELGDGKVESRKFLLLEPYASMDNSMSKSFRLEPPKSKVNKLNIAASNLD